MTVPVLSQRGKSSDTCCMITVAIIEDHLLLAETLGGIQTQLPPGLMRSERQPVDPPEVVEIWFAG